VKIDKEAQEYYAQLTAFYQQFRRIGNNYNQCENELPDVIFGTMMLFLFSEILLLEPLCQFDNLFAESTTTNV